MLECEKIDWAGWEPLGDNQSSRFVNQLRREIGPEHALFDKATQLRASAKDGASDDILVQVPSDLTHAYVVHLSWTDDQNNDTDHPWTCRITQARVPDHFL